MPSDIDALLAAYFAHVPHGGGTEVDEDEEDPERWDAQS